MKPQQDGGESQNDSENGNNSGGVLVDEGTETPDIRGASESEAGYTFLLMLGGCIAGYGVYALLKCWGMPKRRADDK
jgi:hypothetical protein